MSPFRSAPIVRLVGTCLVLLSTLPSVTALAETGVSDERISLPDGPGSVAGVGENVSALGNMGGMSYSVPFELPAGHAGATPQLSLQYSSLAGNEEVGIGWMLMVPHIERFTRHGVPAYTEDDRFALNGGQELVRTATEDGKHIYRARVEGGFVLYSWYPGQGAARGRGGYWVAEYPDGSVGYFGAAKGGGSVSEARLSGQVSGQERETDGVFRYMLVEQVDAKGHRIEYVYGKVDGYPLLKEVRYLFTEGEPRFRVTLTYDERGRPDVISNARARFETVVSRRLSSVHVLSHDEVVRSYALEYEQAASGMSRLVGVQQFGLRAVGDGEHGTRSPAKFSFGYSPSLQVGCQNCQRPYVIEMGTLKAGTGGGVDMLNARATLIDMTGDSLPDMVDTGIDGNHRIFVNALDAEGKPSFTEARTSKVATSAKGFRLEEARVQVVDLNGDGFADMFNANTGDVLCNDGSGEWLLNGSCKVAELPTGLEDGDDGDDSSPEARSRRFYDYDGDRRIDLLYTFPGGAAVQHNLGEEGFQEKPVDSFGKVFDSDNVQFADLNGDGLLDPVEVKSDHLWYRLSLGLGRWEEKGPFYFSERLSPFEKVELQDLNGDGLDDLVLVEGQAVRFALNSGSSFKPFQTLRSADVDGELPNLESTTTMVLFADMNGSGTTDVVWMEAGGRVRALELFPVRPNLLTKVENGLGAVQRVVYGTSAAEQARDAAVRKGWEYHLPQAMTVVTSLEIYSEFNLALVQRVQRSYRNGYYDSLEKMYQGFQVVEERRPGNVHQQTSVTRTEYVVTDPYRQGQVVAKSVSNEVAGKQRTVSESKIEYENCALRGVPDVAEPTALNPEVRFMCQKGITTTLKEGSEDPSAWVTLRSEMDYDDYGNVVYAANLGVVVEDQGGRACGACDVPDGTHAGACGDDCHGDEQFTRTEYVTPREGTGGRWLFGLPSRVRTYAAEGADGEPRGPVTEQLTYYDGEAFKGLARGEAEAGLVTRVCDRSAAGAADDCAQEGWVESLRVGHDAHGNVVASLDPLGKPGDLGGHLRRYEYDPSGLLLVAEEMLLSKDDTAYRLRHEVGYHPLFDLPAHMTRWRLEGSPRAEIAVEYDDLGRRSKVFKPGDSADAPSEEYEYALQAPLSRVVVRSRSTAGGELDMERVQCVDGLGQMLEARARVAEGRYVVLGDRELTPGGLTARHFDNYEGGADCGTGRPAGLAHDDYYYDGQARPLRVVRPDASLYGEASVETTRYAPLLTTRFDAEDNDPTSVGYQTPERTYVDGQGRTVSMERVLRAASEDGSLAEEVGSLKVLWDGLGLFAGYVDAEGNEKRQSHDLLGRVQRVQDPNAGVTTYEYDAASNLIFRTDARGITVGMEYDGANRPVAEYDAAQPEQTVVTSEYDFSTDCSTCLLGEGQIVRTTYPLGEGRGLGSDEYAYDERGRPVRFARNLLGHPFVTTLRYDNADRVYRQTYPDGSVVEKQFDGASRIVGIDGVLDDVHYDSRGLKTAVDFANGVRRELGYDVRQRLEQVVTVGAAGDVLQGLSLDVDRMGTVRGVQDLAHPARLARGMRFDHDAWYRTTEVNFLGDGEKLQFGFDRIDSLTHKVSSQAQGSREHMGNYSYTPVRPNAVQSLGGRQYGYDAAGQLTTRGGTTLQWDHSGNLVHADDGKGRSVEYLYGSGVDRVMELRGGGTTFRIGPNFEVRDGVAVSYVRLGQERVARRSSDAMMVALLGDLNGDDAIGVGDAWVGRADQKGPMPHLQASARRMLLGGEAATVFLHSDHLRNLTLATTAEGEVRGERSFYPTGSVRESRGFVDVHGFTGQREDDVTGLVHFQYRELDPASGRWASVDPLFALSQVEQLAKWGQATTAYAYVAGRFASTFDGDGRELVATMLMGAAAVVGVIAATSFAVGVARGVVDAFARQLNDIRGVKPPAQRAAPTRSCLNKVLGFPFRATWAVIARAPHFLGRRPTRFLMRPLAYALTLPMRALYRKKGWGKYNPQRAAASSSQSRETPVQSRAPRTINNYNVHHHYHGTSGVPSVIGGSGFRRGSSSSASSGSASFHTAASRMPSASRGPSRRATH